MRPSHSSDKARSWIRSTPRALGAAAALGIGLGGAAGCSVLYDLSTTQCNIDTDCAALGTDLICGSNHVCAPKPAEQGCDSNAYCLDRPDNIGESACIIE